MTVDTVDTWLDSALPGYCEATDPGEGDCRTSRKGNFKVEGNATLSWLALVDTCLSLCRQCERCRHITVAIPRGAMWWDVDCSWYQECTQPKPLNGFFHGAVTRSPMQPLPAWPSTPLLPRSTHAVALQLSGHLMSCNYESVALHLQACRARFARCDLFVHSWSTMAPATVHWSGEMRHGRDDSSKRCLQQMKERLDPAAMQTEEQGTPPASSAMAPDGQPYDQGFHWGPARHFGYLMALHAMHRTSALRRRFERRTNVSYAVSMRLRPDDRGDGGFEGIAEPAKLPPLWDCIRAKTARYIQTSDSSELVSCSPAGGGVGSLGNDNCFFGPPRALDAFFEAFEHNSSAVYIEAKRRNYEMAEHETSLVPVAADFAGVRLARHEYVPGRRRFPPRKHTSCHFDDLRLLLLPEVLGLDRAAVDRRNSA